MRRALNSRKRRFPARAVILTTGSDSVGDGKDRALIADFHAKLCKQHPAV
jgi:hypothetical protein